MPARKTALGIGGAVVIGVGLGGAACNGNVDVAGDHGGSGGHSATFTSSGGHSAVSTISTSSSSEPFWGMADAGYALPPCVLEGNCGVAYGPAQVVDGGSLGPDDGGVDAATDAGEDAGRLRGITLYAGPPVPLYAPPPP